MYIQENTLFLVAAPFGQNHQKKVIHYFKEDDQPMVQMQTDPREIKFTIIS